MALRIKDLAEFECPLCQSLLYEPITTACGHNFCKVFYFVTPLNFAITKNLVRDASFGLSIIITSAPCAAQCFTSQQTNQSMCCYKPFSKEISKR